jgi:hypothetical protein
LAATTNGPPRPQRTAGGICRFFNMAAGCHASACTYIHRCTLCSTPTHGATTCGKKKGLVTKQ